jgi:SsrA-binding protein
MGDQPAGHRIIATNRKARHEYEILDTWEAGLVLTGPEVKSLRAGKVSFTDAFARVDGGEVRLYNLHISPYDPASRWNTDPERPRKLLLHGHEIRKLIGGVEERGLSLVPLDLHFRGGYAKATLALVRGKRLHDKRETLKRRVQEREARRALKGS